MSRRSSALLLLSWLAVPGLSLAGDELDAEKVARIRRDEQAAQAKVQAAHGNKKSSEMSNEERRALMREEAAATEGVLEKHGVTAKEYMSYTTRMGRDGQKSVSEAMARQEAEEKARQQAEAQKRAEPQEVAIQQGISDENPVELEASPDAPPSIDVGTPNEAAQASAAEQEAAEEKAPAKKPARGSRRGR